MALTSDTFIERSHLKRQVTFWRLVAVGVFVFFMIMLVERNAKIPEVVNNNAHIARVTIAGTIMDDRQLYDMLDKVKNDDEIKAVILHLDTPGGVAVAGETVYQKIKDISKVKPVVATMRSVCASAGYMIALGADHVLAMKGTITGSIGVIFQAAEFSQLADKIGIKPITVRSGPYKGSPSMTSPMTDDERAILQQMIDEFHATFVEMVSTERDIPLEDVKTIADGRVYSSIRATELKLIDGIGGEPEAIAWLQKEKKIDSALEVRDVEIKSKFDKVMDKLAQSSGLSQIGENVASSTGFLLIWKPDLSN